MDEILNIPSPQRAEMLRTSGFYADAVNQFTEWLKGRPRDAWSLAHRGAARASLGDFSGALSDLEQAIQIKQEFYPWAYAQQGEVYRTYVRDRIPWTEKNLPEIHDKIGKALNAFQKSIEQASSYAWAFAHKGAMHTLACFIYTKYSVLEGDADTHAVQAESCFVTATELNPSYSWAYAFRALLQIIRQQGDALEIMGKALVVDVSGCLHSHRALAELSYWSNDYKESLKQGWLARRADPEDAIINYYIAQCLKKFNDPNADAAIEYARSRLTTLLNQVAMMLAGLDLAKAASDGQEAKEMFKVLDGKQNMEAAFMSHHDPIWTEFDEKAMDVRQAFQSLFHGSKLPVQRGKLSTQGGKK